MEDIKLLDEAVLGTSGERERLVKIARFESAEVGPSHGLLPVILVPEKPKSSLKNLFTHGVQRYEPRLQVYFQHFLSGDVILDFTIGETIRVEDDDNPPAFLVEKSNDDFVLIKKGDREGSDDARINRRIARMEMASFFINFTRMGGLMGKFDEKVGKTAIEKQALVSITTRDGVTLLPQTINFGEMVITQPEKLAHFIIQNRIYDGKEGVGYGHFGDRQNGKISVKDIVWSVVNRSMQQTISKLDHAEIMELPQLGTVRLDIQSKILQSIDWALGEIGFARESATKKVKIRQRVGNFLGEDRASVIAPDYVREDELNDFDNVYISINPDDELAAGLLAQKIEGELKKQTGDQHITYQHILELNPNLSTSEKVHVPPTIKMFGFPALVESIYLDSDRSDESYIEGSTDIRRWVNRSAIEQAFNSPEALDSWWERTYSKIQDGEFPELERKKVADLMIDCLPTVVDWWKGLLRKRKEVSI